ncbi:endonuclease domain-containing protein [Streptomyces sp. NRRL S-813]|uniref:endonuclease domain-containing protein n=1 Tax=Streptomyces sp. NRRL S-813 TaxID=1463919 RepID=UPI002D21BD76|nr:endonuclease domain-containing protein [Streptomyces sp. NRRL S-813]
MARQPDEGDWPVTMTAAEAMAEVRRRDAVERVWLGATTQGRPTFAEAELLDLQGIPSCHVWQVPEGEVPPHLSATDALRRWQAGACAMCSASRGRLLVDHCHRTGLVRGLLCTSCNTAEGMGRGGSFAAYRSRPPAVMLGMAEQYGSAWDGFGT